MSLLSQESGLKLIHLWKQIGVQMSLLSQERGLKFLATSIGKAQEESLLSQERGLNEQETKKMDQVKRTCHANSYPYKSKHIGNPYPIKKGEE